MIAEKEYMDQLAGSPGISPNKRFIEQQMKSQFVNQTDRVPSPIDRLKSGVGELTGAYVAVSRLADTLVGTTPQEGETAKSMPPPQNMIDQIHDAAEAIHMLSRKITVAIERIEARLA